jgi:hypothetical protein
MPLTLDEAKALQYGDILHTPEGKRWKVTGMVKRWVRSPDRIRVPLKHGLYAYDAITEADFTNGVCTLLTKGEPNG